MEPIHNAAYSGNVAEIDRLVAEDGGRLNAQTNTQGRTPLMYAALVGGDPAVTHLLALGADVGHTDTWGKSAAHWACSSGDHSAVLARLLDAGVDMNLRDNHGNTPLILAAEKGGMSCVELLIDRGLGGLDLDAKGEYGSTALHKGSVHLGITQLLLDAEADPTIRNNAGKTALGFILAGHGDEAAIPLLEAAMVEPQRTRTLFKARALIDGARTIDKAFADALKTKRSRVAFTQALLAAAPPYLKGRVANGLPTPWVLLVVKRLVALGSNRAEEERHEVMAAMASMVAAEEELVATVKYVLGLEGGGGVVFEGQEPTVGMLPEVLVELLEMMMPKWDPALKGKPLEEGMH